MNKLTEKQKKFADYYIETGNAEESYKRAGYKSARGNAHKLLQNTAIENYIEKRIQEKDSERIAKQDEVLERLTKILRREEVEHNVVTLKIRKTFIDKNGKRQTIEEEKAEVIPVPAKVSDVNKAAELLGKRYSLWTDNLNVEGNIGVQFVDDIGSDEDDAG